MNRPSVPPLWTEQDSAAFIDHGAVFTPRRVEIARAILDLIPAQTDEPFVAVELGTGDGWLSEALLRRFPQTQVIGLDGSETMRRATARRLAPFAGRVELRPFRLEEAGWLEELPPVRVFYSSLVIHHLDRDGKRGLFTRLLERLEPGGALLIADLVAPTGELTRQYMARVWEESVRQQSIEQTGALDAYNAFVASQWNTFDYPDPLDRPSPLLDQLAWLAELGFEQVDAFWVYGGHAVYGAYKPLPV